MGNFLPSIIVACLFIALGVIFVWLQTLKYLVILPLFRLKEDRQQLKP